MYELIRYIEMCVAPHNTRKKSITLLFDRYKDLMIQYFKHYWFRNHFIEELYNKSGMPLPMLIYSPRKLNRDRTGRRGKVLKEWLYVNKLWHIFYDPNIYKDNKALDEKNFEIWLKTPDILTYAILHRNKNELIKLVAEFLYRKTPWKSSENE